MVDKSGKPTSYHHLKIKPLTEKDTRVSLTKFSLGSPTGHDRLSFFRRKKNDTELTHSIDKKLNKLGLREKFKKQNETRISSLKKITDEKELAREILTLAQKAGKAKTLSVKGAGLLGKFSSPKEKFDRSKNRQKELKQYITENFGAMNTNEAGEFLEKVFKKRELTSDAYSHKTWKEHGEALSQRIEQYGTLQQLKNELSSPSVKNSVDSPAKSAFQGYDTDVQIDLLRTLARTDLPKVMGALTPDNRKEIYTEDLGLLSTMLQEDLATIVSDLSDNSKLRKQLLNKVRQETLRTVLSSTKLQEDLATIVSDLGDNSKLREQLLEKVPHETLRTVLSSTKTPQTERATLAQWLSPATMRSLLLTAKTDQEAQSLAVTLKAKTDQEAQGVAATLEDKTDLKQVLTDEKTKTITDEISDKRLAEIVKEWADDEKQAFFAPNEIRRLAVQGTIDANAINAKTQRAQPETIEEIVTRLENTTSKTFATAFLQVKSQVIHWITDPKTTWNKTAYERLSALIRTAQGNQRRALLEAMDGNTLVNALAELDSREISGSGLLKSVTPEVFKKIQAAMTENNKVRKLIETHKDDLIQILKQTRNVY